MSDTTLFHRMLPTRRADVNFIKPRHLVLQHLATRANETSRLTGKVDSARAVFAAGPSVCIMTIPHRPVNSLTAVMVIPGTRKRKQEASPGQEIYQKRCPAAKRPKAGRV